MTIDKNNIVIVEDGFCLWAYFNHARIGYLKSVRQEDGRVLLGDVMVEPRVIFKRGVRANLIRKLFPHWGIIYPRCSGVGTKLILQLIECCEREGVVEMFGNVTPDADVSQPFLRQWYERLGFIIQPPDRRVEFFEVAYKVAWNPVLRRDRGDPKMGICEIMPERLTGLDLELA